MLDAQSMKTDAGTLKDGQILMELVTTVRRQRWDMPDAFIKTIIHQLDHLSSGSYRTLCYDVGFVNCFLRAPELRSAPLRSFIARDAIRWVGALLQRTVSSSSPTALLEIDLRAQIRVVIECLTFFSFCISADALFAIQVVDTGVLLSIFKARHLLIHDAINSPHDDTIASQSLRLFSTSAKISIYRSILIRLVPWVNRIQRRRMDVFDNQGVSVCQSVQKSWEHLKNVVSQRRARKKQAETLLVIEAEQQICENHECSNGGVVPVSSYYRCSDCKSHVYCSRTCYTSGRKAHKGVCAEIGRQIREGYFARLPRTLDFVFMRDQFLSDLHNLNARISRLFSEWAVKNTKAPIVWIDYNDFPFALEAQSIEDSTKRLNELGWKDPTACGLRFHMDSEVLGVHAGGISAVAVVPGMNSPEGKTFPLVVGIDYTWAVME
ncbi:hypothetical protein V5O48_017019 [Marasmius crinis-equi]|uniref:MYND-type domain-containing protein n=1 Tax=Marasmius crinis-equi TaxID=585013 RepID=A0ABR3EQC9_9AGAR